MRCENERFALKESRIPVKGPASLHSHPVDSKVHLPDKRRHANGHGVSRAQHHAGLLPHDPAGGSAGQRRGREDGWRLMLFESGFSEKGKLHSLVEIRL